MPREHERWVANYRGREHAAPLIPNAESAQSPQPCSGKNPRGIGSGSAMGTAHAACVPAVLTCARQQHKRSRSLRPTGSGGRFQGPRSVGGN